MSDTILMYVSEPSVTALNTGALVVLGVLFLAVRWWVTR